MGIEVIEQDYLHGELFRSNWVRSWPNGNDVSVENTDLSVAEAIIRLSWPPGQGFRSVTCSARPAPEPTALVARGEVFELTEAPLQEGHHFLPISVPSK